MTFSFFLGGYFHDHSYRLVLRDDVLLISDYIGLPIPEHEKTVSVMENNDWEQLLNFLDNCRWKKRYDSEILDGTQWELKAKGKSFNINSSGSNAYPENFNVFLELLNKVINPTGISLIV
jgi:hypothetical protein